MFLVGPFFLKESSTEGWNGEMLDHFPQNLAAQKLWEFLLFIFDSAQKLKMHVYLFEDAMVGS